MYEQVEKPKGNRSRTVANSVAQKKSYVKQGFGFVDNRPEAIAQRKLINMVNSSLQEEQTSQLQAMANEHSAQQPLLQKKDNNTGLPDNLKSGIDNLSGGENCVQLNSDAAMVIQCNGQAIAELKEHMRNIPKYMHEAIWRWVSLLGASAVLAYLTGGSSLVGQATMFLLPTTGWLATGAIKFVKDRLPFSGGGLKIGLGPLIEDTFHLATYNFPWLPGSYGTINKDTEGVNDGNYIFIFDVSNNFYYVTSADREVEGAHLYIRHSQLAGGNKVKTAGRMIVKEKICTLTNESGHYWPTFDSLEVATKFLNHVNCFQSVNGKAFKPKEE